jgi:hypothetical protein
MFCISLFLLVARSLTPSFPFLLQTSVLPGGWMPFAVVTALSHRLFFFVSFVTFTNNPSQSNASTLSFLSVQQVAGRPLPFGTALFQ